MSNRQKFYINGEWVEPSTSETLDVINPATEEPIDAIAMGGAADVDKAVAAAKAAFEFCPWSTAYSTTGKTRKRRAMRRDGTCTPITAWHWRKVLRPTWLRR